ncbi:gp53-like domain-containing protein [Photorhabdus tasmaniensis]|uniref:gp53-like domain-containing protein n=1 Tax=Photorhabdus tasmaniensis TaxID=1004159 RepID=UPI001F61C690|nr:hypothetical protein [Photorhabdus tasmaniensis]
MKNLGLVEMVNLAKTEGLLNSNGYINIPLMANGVQKNWIFQWMTGPICNTEDVTYPILQFPLTFPTMCLIALTSTKGNDTKLSDQVFQVSSWTNSSVKVFPQWFGTGKQSLCYPLIIAIGY